MTSRRDSDRYYEVRGFMGDNLNITAGFLRSVEALLEILELDADKASPSVEGR